MFTVGDYTYVPQRMPAKQQFHIVRRLAPFIGQIAPVLATLKTDGLDAGLAALKPLGDALAGMSDTDADYVLFGLLRSCKRQAPGGTGLVEVAVGDSLNHLDITLAQMLQIAGGVLKFNLADFMGALPSDLRGALQTAA